MEEQKIDEKKATQCALLVAGIGKPLAIWMMQVTAELMDHPAYMLSTLASGLTHAGRQLAGSMHILIGKQATTELLEKVFEQIRDYENHENPMCKGLFQAADQLRADKEHVGTSS